MSKRTPGPWKAVNDGQDIEILNAAGTERIAFMCKPGMAGGVTEECEANGALFAAAPELLEAAIDAKKYLEPDLVEPGRTIFWKLVNAIAKAEES